MAVAALDAVHLVGLPEGTLPMTQAATYLATAPKSNTVLTTYAAARKAVHASTARCRCRCTSATRRRR